MIYSIFAENFVENSEYVIFLNVKYRKENHNVQLWSKPRIIENVKSMFCLQDMLIQW